MPPKEFFRLAPGREVRLRYAYFVTCTGVVKDAAGEIVEVRAPTTRRPAAATRRTGGRCKGTIHWVSAAHAVDAEVRLYDRLFTVRTPTAVPEGSDFLSALNPESLVALRGKVEPSVAADPTRNPIPVRAGRLFHQRYGGLRRGRPGVQPDRGVAGLVGQGQEQVK